MERNMKRQDNSGEHIDEIIGRTTCERHQVGKGVACFYIYYNTRKGELGEGICNNRVKKAGFNGKINPSSLRKQSRDGNKYTRT